MQNPNGYLGAIPNPGDTLAGTFRSRWAMGAEHMFDISTLSDQTLPGLADAINSAGIGVTANIVTKNGASTLTLRSQIAGAAGALAVTSSIVDQTMSNQVLNYTESSDLPGLTGLGISMNNDGTISLDVNLSTRF